MHRTNYLIPVFLVTFFVGMGFVSANPLVENVTVSATGATSLTVTWDTNETGYNNTVYYGLTSSLGSSETTDTNSTSPSIAVSSLQTHTKYYYKVQSCTIGEACTNSSVYSSYTAYNCGSADSAVPCDVVEGLPSAGTAIGSFLTNLAPGVGTFIFVIGVFVGIVAILAGIVVAVKAFFEKGTKKP